MKALLVIDMQKTLFAAGNRHDTYGVISRINKILQKARSERLPIFFIRHNSDGDGLRIDSEGWQILDELDFQDNDTIIEKTNCDSFCETNLAEELIKINVDELIITGCCTDFCIDTTVRKAASMGYKVQVAADAHTTSNKPYLDAATIIKHHNFVWSEMYVPQLIKVELTEKIIESL